MQYKDYYDIMGVDRGVSQDDLKKTYRKLARKYHPDVSKEPDAEKKFKDVGEAYEVLRDPEKRAAYDQLGANWKAGQDFNPPPGWDGGFGQSGGFRGRSSQGGGFSDFFDELFGQHGAGGGFGQRNAKGEDHQAKILIDLDDAFNGAKRTISLRLPQAGPDGRMVHQERSLSVSIPKGIKAGQRIRLTGQGAPGPMGQAGDLLLEIQFKPHTVYKVDDTDLSMDCPITPWEAALGAKITVPTPNGKVELNVPAGARSGQKMRLKGRGIPGKTPGDLYVVLQITNPPADTDEAKALYEEMRDKLAFNPRSRLGV
ncbi:curved DNA-binding protein-like [Artemia franciscana]|uniref:J domain-containing protein n=1 Tax=Artemia franciscana TaxID=6661 RepID=A0AA88HAB6_ARTSF|nr:hypothetical protein QYM36_019587 [Artemia franciscana]